MRTSVLCLAASVALCLVLPLCDARPGVCSVKKFAAKQAAAASSSEESSSEEVVKKAGCGCGCGKAASLVASKKKIAKAAVSAVSSSASSLEVTNVAGKPCIGKILATPKNVVSKCGCKLLSEAQIKETYSQKKGESLDVYFKRIVSKSYTWTSTTEGYLKTLTHVWKDFSSLDLWYDRKYIDLIKDFYTVYYAKLDSETLESYYSRIVKKEAWETDECFARRITVVRDCFPDLDLWTSEQWFDKYTRSLYALEFKKFSFESEADYIKRIFEKDAYFDFTDYKWAKRIFLVQEATISNCPLWYNEAYLSYFKNFYSIWYKKQEKETCDAWLLRALTPLPGESLDNAIKRVKFIKSVTGDCGCWKLDYFKKIQSAKSLQNEWLVKVQKAFFPCGCGGVKVERSASKKSSSASSASASESSEYAAVKVA